MVNLLLTLALLSNTPDCPSNLKPTEDDIGYRLRDGRCEGAYVQSLSSPSLALIGLARFRRLPEVSYLTLDCHAGNGRRVLRADAIPADQRAYFRMDHTFASDEHTYRWSLSLAKGIGLTSKDFSVLCFSSERIPNLDSRTHYPVSYSEAKSDDSVYLTLVANIALKKLSIRINSVTESGEVAALSNEERATNSLPGKPFSLKLAAPKCTSPSCTYEVRIASGSDVAALRVFVTLVGTPE